MKARDFAIVAAVLLLGGFALADSLRSRAPEETATTREESTGPEPQPDAPADWPAGRLRGTLVFTSAENCSVRVIGLGGGRERPTGALFGFCDLWAAPIGQRIAYGTGGVRGTTGQSFAVVDLRRSGVELERFLNLAGGVLWSPDAQRLAWCTENGVGREYEIGAERPRSFPNCPIAYTPQGRLAFAVGRRLVVDGRTVLTAPGPIVEAYWGQDGSLLILQEGGRLRRYDASGETDSTVLLVARNLVPSPDNCAVLYSESGRIQLADVGCFRAPQRAFIGFDGAWSPDGVWVAVAAPDQIEFHRVLGGQEAYVWPARARELSWRGDD